MQSIDFCYATAIICAIYLINLWSKKTYRLLLPSIIHSITWLITSCLLICELNGFWVTHQIPNSSVNASTEFTFYLVIASIVGFSTAHLIGNIRKQGSKIICIETNTIDAILKKFKWIPYTCFILGCAIFLFLFSTIGIANTFGEFREHAVNQQWSGPIAYVKQASGHIYIFASFYLILLGYKHGKEGLNVKELFKYGIFCSMTNMAIGGRLWIVTSFLPYITAFIYSRKFSKRDRKSLKKDIKKLLMVIAVLAGLFSLMGLARDDRDIEKRFIDKFLYFTDGTKMSNMVLTQYPPGTYELEYGTSQFLTQFKKSPMEQKFKNSISYDRGLAVTVRSFMPPLYYDFGYIGGVFMWGIICFIIELISIKLMATRKVLGILWFVLLSQMLFLTPIFEIFAVNMPTFEWLIIMAFFSKALFNIKTGTQHKAYNTNIN